MARLEIGEPWVWAAEPDGTALPSEDGVGEVALIPREPRQGSSPLGLPDANPLDLKIPLLQRGSGLDKSIDGGGWSRVKPSHERPLPEV